MRIRSLIFVTGLFAIVGIVSLGLFSVSTARTMTVEERLNSIAVKTNLQAEDASGEYSFDKAHSTIGFRIRHMGLTEVLGAFRDFTGTVKYDAKDVSKSSVEFTAQMKSVDTGVAGRDNHLRTADFFEVEKFAEMTFKSTSVVKKGKKLTVNGDLTMKGVTKPVSLQFTIVGPVTDQRGGVKMGFIAGTTINRRDYNVTYGGNLPNGTPVLADNVTVDLQIEANKKK